MSEFEIFAQLCSRLLDLNEKRYKSCLCLGAACYAESLKHLADKVSLVIQEEKLIPGMILYMGNQLGKIYLTDTLKVYAEESYDLVLLNHWFSCGETEKITVAMALLYAFTKSGGTIVLREKVNKNKSLYPPLDFYNNLISALGLRTLKSSLSYFNRHCVICMILIKETMY
mgnify:CR=1 FL=1